VPDPAFLFVPFARSDEISAEMDLVPISSRCLARSKDENET